MNHKRWLGLWVLTKPLFYFEGHNFFQFSLVWFAKKIYTCKERNTFYGFSVLSEYLCVLATWIPSYLVLHYYEHLEQMTLVLRKPVHYQASCVASGVLQG